MAQVVVVQNSASGTWKGRYTGCCTDMCATLALSRPLECTAAPHPSPPFVRSLYPSLCTSCAHADVAQYNGDSWCMAWCCYSMCGRASFHGCLRVRRGVYLLPPPPPAAMCGPCFRASARAKLASSTGVQDTIGCCDMLFGSVFYLAQELGHIRANPQKVMS